jgi:hypothetical protein
MNKFTFIIFLIFITNSPTSSQNFKRIEVLAKISNIEDVNGIAVADIDGDYDLDIFAVVRQKELEPGEGLESRLFLNNGDGTYSDITISSGIDSKFDYSNIRAEDGLTGMKYGASWGDFDNDGLPDLLLTSVNHIELYKNIDGRSFVDVTKSAAIPSTSSCVNTGATWWDYDNDGYLDFYITRGFSCEDNLLFRNRRNGTFTEVTNLLTSELQNSETVDKSDPSWMSMPIDIDSDGWLDLYVSNDFDVPSRLYKNKGPLGFEETATNFALIEDSHAMGVTIGDPNNDGLFDFYVSDIDESTCYIKNTNGKYDNQANQLGISETGWAWGTKFADFDNDGDEDLMVVNGYGTLEENYYYENQLKQGKFEFLNKIKENSLQDKSDANGLAVFDYDNDGDLDMLISNSDEKLFFYENQLIQKGISSKNNWVQFQLQGTRSNRNAIGTKLELTTKEGKLYRFYNGVNLYAQNLIPVHFGLGNISEIHSLKVTWPSGEENLHKNLPINKIIAIKEGSLPVVLDIKSEKTRGCTDQESCSYDPNATEDDGTCEYLETQKINGNEIAANLTSEVYTTNKKEGYNYQWSVDGGNIEKGQNTNEVTIHWNLNTIGKVSVKISDGNCYSQETLLNVDLKPSEGENSQSIARIWNELLLEAIRNDYARPTVHARNLFHLSVAMYDAWAIYNPSKSTPYLLGNKVGNYKSDFNGFQVNGDTQEAVNKTISYAAYRLLRYRFKNSPYRNETLDALEGMMDELGYDKSISSINYKSGNPAELGNYIANQVINLGKVDESREATAYDNAYYTTINPPLNPDLAGNKSIINPNRWQTLQLLEFIDQAGNPIDNSTPDFLSPEWGSVTPFALTSNELSIFSRDGNEYNVFHDPGTPPRLDTITKTDSSELYKWNFSMVSTWSSHLDPNDGVSWDISPGSIGNLHIDNFPRNFSEQKDFYDYINGADKSNGHSVNPTTGLPYEEQIVPRGDYTRVLAEFWADGPDSETPPGHWFTILNYINDHEDLEKRFEGIGEIIEDLEWDIKSYFTLSAAMHDSAISAWGIKGWYDYLRPISAIRFMAEKGQSSDASKANYHIAGIPLVKDYIELIESGDNLAGANGENIGKIKVFAWKGPKYIQKPDTDMAGVDWILAEDWWPYQRPSFVTPPFAGYVSGHSTFSRAAAEVLTAITGDPYFPGGMGEFIAKKNEFLVFEEGPSQDVILQWATYRDASDQCSLSRIWGGIHPPADDIPGRLIGEQIGKNAFELAKQYFVESTETNNITISYYPNPVKNNLFLKSSAFIEKIEVYNIYGKKVKEQNFEEKHIDLNISQLNTGLYWVYIFTENGKNTMNIFKE